jgi:hypothetical protein
MTLALSGAAAAALLVVAGAVVVQANSKEVPVVAVGDASQRTEDGGSAAGKPVEPPSTQPTADPVLPTDSPVPVGTLDIEEPEKSDKKKRSEQPVAQIPTQPSTAQPRPQTKNTQRPQTTSTPKPTRTKKKSTTSVDPELEPSEPAATNTAGPSIPSVAPTKKPTTKPTVAPKPNPYKPAAVCGSGYKIIDSHAVGERDRVYLLYNASAGKNCVVMMSALLYTGKVKMNAILQVKGGASASNPGMFSAYAGPVRLPAKGKCVIWGGSIGAASWKSGWSHCG